MRDGNEAIRSGVDAWALNDETIRELKRRGVDLIAVYEVDTKDFWLTPARHYYDPATYKLLNHPTKPGCLPVPPQRSVHRKLFVIRKADVKLTARGKRKPKAPLSAAAIT